MKNNDLFNSTNNPDFQPSGPDLCPEESFKQKVHLFLKSITSESVEEIIDRVNSMWSVSYDGPFKEAETSTALLKGASLYAGKKAEDVEKQLQDGTIPKNVPGETSFAAPRGLWAKTAFFTLIAVSGGATSLEWVNFGWALRYITESFPLGLAYAFPVFAIPLGEAAYLLILKPKPRVRKIAATVQTLVALVSAIAYTALSLLRSDGSLSSSFTEIQPGFSTDSWRMAFQLLTSLSIAALCLHAAFSIGKNHFITNQAHLDAETKAADFRQESEDYRKALAEIEKNLARAAAVRADAILFCTQKHAQIQTNRQNHSNVANQILNEKP